MAAGTGAIVELGRDVLRFRPLNGASPGLNIVFDDILNHIFVVHEDGRTVDVLSQAKPEPRQWILPEHGEPVRSLRFSLDGNVLAYYYEPRTLNFLTIERQSFQATIKVCSRHSDQGEFTNTLATSPTSVFIRCKSKLTSFDLKQPPLQIHTPMLITARVCSRLMCRVLRPTRQNKLAEIKYFYWTGPDDVVVVTNLSIELYRIQKLLEHSCSQARSTHQVNVKRRSTKLVKAVNTSVSWCIYSRGGITKIPRFEVAPSASPEPRQTGFTTRDVCICKLYNRLYLAVVRNNSKSHAGPKSEVTLYLITKEGVAKAHSLHLDVNGRLLMSAVDNLLLVHHATTETTFAFDIACKVTTSRAAVGSGSTEWFTHRPVFQCKIPPTVLDDNGSDRILPAYGESLLCFQPAILIDARAGCLWSLELYANRAPAVIQDFTTLFDVLSRRTGAAPVMIELLSEVALAQTPMALRHLTYAFDCISNILAKANRPNQKRFNYQTLRQIDVCHKVFLLLQANEEMSRRFLIRAVTEYIRSLSLAEVPVEHLIYEMLINMLVSGKQFYQLHQFFQYHVFDDSEPMACFLLSLQMQYPPAYQLAMDMFKRIESDPVKICDILLTCGFVLPALRYIKSFGRDIVGRVPAKRFLEAALASNDDMLFYNVYNFFIMRNVTLRNKSAFLPDEDCDKFVRLFDTKFGRAGNRNN
ncbi:uncharacterized protein MONBRDRAFT_33838 [Monosiga brevicollis MX1]|uniref:Mic1 domain-containing protein n=1 Tax=Monosiga brevicollis TaxID=81824 RepID=A9V7U8_MONBE|nr:uncharacterized protein MONBRDRAFT_33838 [Monosiga brevicollis MX1]EDQ86439.1 predicted protein [Monosiga brevicollis MX1]|eukprot:XP_001748829.1 hypothetical protein [Monosiga brevicollis MX1]